MRRIFPLFVLVAAIGFAGRASAEEVVVVVAEESSISALSPVELSDIFLGRMTRLPGGESVRPFDQTDNSSAYKRFYQQHLGRSQAEIRAHWSKLIFTGRGQPPRSYADAAATAQALLADPNAVGYMHADAVGEGLRIVEITR